MSGLAVKDFDKATDVFAGSVKLAFAAMGSAGDGTWGLVRLVATLG